MGPVTDEVDSVDVEGCVGCSSRSAVDAGRDGVQVGLFTKPCDRDEVLRFIDAFQRGDDVVQDSLGDRIFKTKNKSSPAVIDALLVVSQILVESGQSIDPAEADRFVSGASQDRPAVAAAKRELVVAFFASPDPVFMVNETMGRHAADPTLSNVDRMDNLLSLLFSAGLIAIDRGLHLRFGPATSAPTSDPGASPVAAPQLGVAPPGTTPADWYPDPHGAARLRYWDGAAWTEHTA